MLVRCMCASAVHVCEYGACVRVPMCATHSISECVGDVAEDSSGLTGGVRRDWHAR